MTFGHSVGAPIVVDRHTFWNLSFRLSTCSWHAPSVRDQERLPNSVEIEYKVTEFILCQRFSLEDYFAALSLG